MHDNYFHILDFVEEARTPTSLQVTDAYRDTVQLAWEAPNLIGGADSIEYILHKHKIIGNGEERMWKPCAITKQGICEATIIIDDDDLLEDSEYLFRVAIKGTEDFFHTVEPLMVEAFGRSFNSYGNILFLLTIEKTQF